MGYAGLISSGSDAGIVALINDTTKGGALLQPVSMVYFAKVAAISGVRQKVTNGLTSATYGALCQTAIDMLAELTIQFDPTDGLTQQIMGALVTAGVLTSSDVAGIQTACTLPCSRAQSLWGYGTVVQQSDVSLALRGH